MANDTWTRRITGPAIVSGSVVSSRQPNLRFDGPVFQVSTDVLNNENVVTINAAAITGSQGPPGASGSNGTNGTNGAPGSAGAGFPGQITANTIANGVFSNAIVLTQADLTASVLGVATLLSGVGTTVIGNINTDNASTGLVSSAVSLFSGSVVYINSGNFDGNLASSMPWTHGRRVRINFPFATSSYLPGSQVKVKGIDWQGFAFNETVWVQNLDGGPGASVLTNNFFKQVTQIVVDPQLSNSASVQVGAIGSEIVFNSLVLPAPGQVIRPDVTSSVRLVFNGGIHAPPSQQLFDVSQMSLTSTLSPIRLPKNSTIHGGWFGLVGTTGNFSVGPIEQAMQCAIWSGCDTNRNVTGQAGGAEIVLPPGELFKTTPNFINSDSVTIRGGGYETTTLQYFQSWGLDITQLHNQIPTVDSVAFPGKGLKSAFFGRDRNYLDCAPPTAKTTYGQPNYCNGTQALAARCIFQPQFHQFWGVNPLGFPVGYMQQCSLLQSVGAGGTRPGLAALGYVGGIEQNQAFSIQLIPSMSSGVTASYVQATLSTPSHQCWQANHAYPSGTLVTPTFPNGFIYGASTNFTSSATEPGPADYVGTWKAWPETFGAGLADNTGFWVNLGPDVPVTHTLTTKNGLTAVYDAGGPYEVLLNYGGGNLYLWLCDRSTGIVASSSVNLGPNLPVFQGWYEWTLIGGDLPTSTEGYEALANAALSNFAGYMDSTQILANAAVTPSASFAPSVGQYSGPVNNGFTVNWGTPYAGGLAFVNEGYNGGYVGLLSRGQAISFISGSGANGLPTSYAAELHHLNIQGNIDYWNSLHPQVHDINLGGSIMFRLSYEGQISNVVITPKYNNLFALGCDDNSDLTVTQVNTQVGQTAYWCQCTMWFNGGVCEDQYRYGAILNGGGSYASLNGSFGLGNETGYYHTAGGVCMSGYGSANVSLGVSGLSNNVPAITVSDIAGGSQVGGNYFISLLGDRDLTTQANPTVWVDPNNVPTWVDVRLGSAVPGIIGIAVPTVNDWRLCRFNNLGTPYRVTLQGAQNDFSLYMTDKLVTNASDDVAFTGFSANYAQNASLYITDVSGGNGFSLHNQSTNSAAGHRINTFGSLPMVGLKGAQLTYDAGASSWNVVSAWPSPVYPPISPPTLTALTNIDMWDANGGQVTQITGSGMQPGQTLVKIGANYANVNVCATTPVAGTSGSFVVPANMAAFGGSQGSSVPLSITLQTNGGSSVLPSASFYLPAGMQHFYRADIGLNTAAGTWQDIAPTSTPISILLSGTITLTSSFASSSLPGIQFQGTQSGSIYFASASFPQAVIVVAEATGSKANIMQVYGATDGLNGLFLQLNRAGLGHQTDSVWLQCLINGVNTVGNPNIIAAAPSGTNVPHAYFGQNSLSPVQSSNNCDSFFQDSTNTIGTGLGRQNGYVIGGSTFVGNMGLFGVWGRYLNVTEHTNVYNAMKWKYPALT